MPRCDAFHAVRWRAWMIGLVFSTGCAHSQTDLQTSLTRRVTPIELGVDQPESRREITTADETAKDVMVRPAAASQRGQATATQSGTDPSVPPIPVPGIPPSRLVSGSGSSTSTPATLPSDSDDAALDAVAANGRPLTVPEAIHMAFRFQPRLHAQLESIAQARGLQQIAFSAFLPVAAANYDVGEYSLGVGRQTDPSGEGFRDSASCPAWEPCPSASTSGRTSSWPSSKFNGCSSTSVAGWAAISRRDWRTTSLHSRPIAHFRLWPTRSRSHTTTS